MLSFDVEDTIAAVATAAGSSLRGIIRISGPGCEDCLKRVVPDFMPAASAVDTYVRQFSAQVELGDDLSLPTKVLFWPSTKSYTRQPSAEFHTLGSPPLLKQALRKICESGARLARPGEFTLRAFLSGRLDLAQAEAVLAVIDADDQQQLKGALAQLAGGLSGPLARIRDQILFVLAELEAGLDFVEEDIEFISHDVLIRKLDGCLASVNSVAAQIRNRNLDEIPMRVGLIGQPNAGKSSLFNALAGEDRAIVTNLAGTTTDFLVARFMHESRQIELVDTAGFEVETQSTVSRHSQSQRQMIESSCAVKVLCIDSTHPLGHWESTRLGQNTESLIVALTKSDAPARIDEKHLRESTRFMGPVVVTSAKTAEGILPLKQVMDRACSQTLAGDAEIIDATMVRAANSILASEKSLEMARSAAVDSMGEEVIAAELHQALDSLGEVVGTIYTDDILDVVFSRFCIGK